MGFKLKIIANIVLASFICAIVSVSSFIYFNRKDLEFGIINRQRTIQNQLLAATNFVATQNNLRSTIEKIRAKYTQPDQLTKEDKRDIMNQVPIVASLRIGKANADRDQYIFRVFSDQPRNKDNQATPKEMGILNRFANDPNLDELVVKEGDLISFYRPVRINQAAGCLECHGSPTKSPWGNGLDILGYPMENWSDGKLVGVFEIRQNIKEVYAASIAGQTIPPRMKMILAILGGAVVSVLLSMIFIRGGLNQLDFISNALNRTFTSLKGTAFQVSESSAKLAQATEEQAASLTETASALIEISSMIEKTTDSAQTSSSHSQKSLGKAQACQQMVQNMEVAMDEIHQSNSSIMTEINNNQQKMEEIIQVIQEISSKTKLIDEIVFQTKLLSFNASVEAARAGEHGKGFAVVAEEVGSLARMSGQASKEISVILTEGTKKVQAIVDETKMKVSTLSELNEEKIRNGLQLARECSQMLGDMVEKIGEVNRLASQISTANQEQTRGIQEISSAMHQLEEVTQLNKVTSQETHVASENLNEQVVQLSKVMENINEILKGQSENLSSTNLFRPQSKPDSKNPPPAKAFPKEESHPHFSSTG